MLERHASDIADAVVDLLPTQDAVEKNGADQILHTACDIRIDANGQADWSGFETRRVSSAVSRILRSGE